MDVTRPTNLSLHRRLLHWLRQGAWWWSACVAALLLATWAPEGMQRLDLLAYDLALPRSAPSAQAPIVLAIDDHSLARLGPWPWSRALHARMIDRLAQSGAASVGIAVLFAEADQRDASGDAALAAAISRYGRVALAVAPWPTDDEGLQPSPLSPALADLPGGPVLGHVDVELGLDGQARSQYLYAGLDRPQWPALALAVKQLAIGSGSAGARTALPTLVRGRKGTWVRSGEVFPPAMTALPLHSFSDALDSPDLERLVRGRSVFIGVTASGLAGLLTSPLAPAHEQLPSVLFHAQTFDALQSDRLLRPAPAFVSLSLALLLVCALALLPRGEWPGALGVRVLGIRALVAGVLLALPASLSWALLHSLDLWVPPALATAALAVALLFREAGKLRTANRRLQRSRRYAQAAMQAISDAVITVDAQQHTIRFANRSAVRLADRPLEGRALVDAYPLAPQSSQRLSQALEECLSQARDVQLDDLQSRSAQGERTLRATLNPLGDPDGPVSGAVLVFTDITAQLAAAHEREHAATHDALTGLPNRKLLQDRLHLTLARVRRQGSTAALMFVDLDRFKQVNDSLGHRAGDQVLGVVAHRLRDLCRDTDTVARWGGDEFVLILEDVAGPEGAAAAAAKVVHALSQEIALGPEHQNRRLPSAASVGIVLMPRDGERIDELLTKADTAMYRAKSQPKASFQFWAAELDAQMQDRLTLEVELRRALQLGQLTLHYQPQFGLADGALVGMEALMRWQRTPGQMVPPGAFIPVAEESGLILDMGAWAMRQAADQIAAWQRAQREAVPVAVNVSGRQCMHGDFVQTVREALQASRIAPHLLRLEITESTAMAEGDQVMSVLREVQALGVSLSLDDFGTGYSSLAYLKRFPIDEIKIDRSFVQALPHARDDAAIVQATIALAHGLGLHVVAEGVETEAQRLFLQSLRCNAAQGFLLGRPQPPDNASTLLR